MSIHKVVTQRNNFINENSPKTEKSDDLDFLIKFFGNMKYIIGLKKIKLENGSIRLMGKIYKLYSTIFLIIISTLVAYNFTLYTNPYYSTNFSFSVKLTLSFTQIALWTSYIAVTLRGIYTIPKMKLKMYNTLKLIDISLTFPIEEKSNNFKIWTVGVHVIFFIIKFILYMGDVWAWTFNATFYMVHFVAFVVDLEFLDRIIEINMIARRFEKLNFCLKSLKKICCANVCADFDMKDGLLLKLWRKNFNAQIDISKKVDAMQLFQIYEKLSIAIKEINNIFGIPVFFTFYIISTYNSFNIFVIPFVFRF